MINNIIKSELYGWRKIKDLQPKGFKTSLRDEVLKATLQKHGISRSFSVWQDKKGDVYCIDGHQRKRVLEDLANEGVDVPELLMCEFIHAENKKQASEILIEVFNQKHSEMDFFEFEKFVDEFDLDIDLGLDDLLMFRELEDEDIENKDYSDKNKEFGSDDFENQKYTIKLEFSEDDYNFVKDKLQHIGQTPEKIIYDALISL